MPNRYIDDLAEDAINSVIASYRKSNTGIGITRSQAISAMYGAWLKLHRGDEKE
jgi:ABC-type phosphate transport system permease subunit